MTFPSPRAFALLELFDVKRDDWDPNDNTPRKNREVDSIDTFELHHTGSAGPRSLSFDGKLAWGLDIEAYHENNKGWTDLFYNVFVFADGEIWGGRRPDRSSQGDIPTTLTVHIPGNNPTITPEQHASLLRVARWCTDAPNHVRGHSDRAATACPGDNGRRELIRIREELAMPALPPIQIIPEDLRDNKDYLEAVKKGFISDADPDRVASRSVAAVIANRVDKVNQIDVSALQGQVTALGVRVASLEGKLAATPGDIVLTEGVKQAIVEELVKRLAE